MDNPTNYDEYDFSDLTLNEKVIRYDPRFPNTNQTRNCWQNYVDFHKCVAAKGPEFKPCKKFQFYYSRLCPDEWIERWDTAIEENRSPFDLSPPQLK